MKTILLFIAFGISGALNAQVTHVSLQASGLTCSMCSNSINKALMTLDFVQKVDADIKTYTYEIFIKPGSKVDFDQVRKKVENAGFSVSSFSATILFNNVPVVNQAVTIEDKTILFVNIKDQSLNGARKIKIVDKGFVTPKEYKRNALPVPSSLTYHATI